MDELALAEGSGWLYWPMVAVGACMWTLVMRRALLLWPFRQGRLWIADASPQATTEVEMLEHVESMSRYRLALSSLVQAAPLLGLLGTVGGMIRTFADSEASATAGLFSAGVAQALLTTELGLVIAIPGLLLSRFLDGWECRATEGAEMCLDALTASPSQELA